MAERKLRNRRKRFSKGKAIRISDLLYKHLDSGRGRNSWDTHLRRMFGLPDRKGVTCPLVEGMLETTTGLFVLKLPDTTWPDLERFTYTLAEKMAVKRKLRKPSQPLRMRESR